VSGALPGRNAHVPYAFWVGQDDLGNEPIVAECLANLGYEVCATTCQELLGPYHAFRPDLLLVDGDMPDSNVLAALQEIFHRHPLPIIMIASCHDSATVATASRAHVLAYLVKPIKSVELKVAITLASFQFERLQSLYRELTVAREALKNRKLIEHARGVVMQRLGVDTLEAMHRLQSLASDQNRKLVEIAREVLNAEKLFAAMATTKPPARARAVALSK
jgi:AmiR/NasT family two-component response regulator